MYIARQRKYLRSQDGATPSEACNLLRIQLGKNIERALGVIDGMEVSRVRADESFGQD